MTTAPATWSAVAMDCRNQADLAHLIAEIVKIPAAAPPWWAAAATSRIRGAYVALAGVYDELADTATTYAVDAAAHEGMSC